MATYGIRVEGGDAEGVEWFSGIGADGCEVTTSKPVLQFASAAAARREWLRVVRQMRDTWGGDWGQVFRVVRLAAEPVHHEEREAELAPETLRTPVLQDGCQCPCRRRWGVPSSVEVAG